VLAAAGCVAGSRGAGVRVASVPVGADRVTARRGAGSCWPRSWCASCAGRGRLRGGAVECRAAL